MTRGETGRSAGKGCITIQPGFSLKNFHRILSQSDEEPLTIILFKWIIIIGGIGMLVIVVILMTEVVHDFFTGTESDWLGISYSQPSINMTGRWDLMLNRMNSTYQMFENSNTTGEFMSGMSELNDKWDRENANTTEESKGGITELHSQWDNSTLEGLL